MQLYPLEVSKVSATLGGSRVLRTDVTSITDLLLAVEHGLPRAVVAALVAAAIPANRPDRQPKLAALIEHPDTSNAGPDLSPASSERAERIARVTALAHQALGSNDEAKDWLTQLRELFSGRMPIEVAVTDLGAPLVERTLLNIGYGPPAWGRCGSGVSVRRRIQSGMAAVRRWSGDGETRWDDR